MPSWSFKNLLSAAFLLIRHIHIAQVILHFVYCKNFMPKPCFQFPLETWILSFVINKYLKALETDQKSNIDFIWFSPGSFHLVSSKIQISKKCNFSKFGSSRNIQSGLRQIPNLAHICIQDWKNMKITISKIGST